MADRPDDAQPEAPAAGTRRVPLLAGVIVVLLVLVGALVAVIIADNDDEPDYDTAQIGRLQQACRDWHDSAQAPDGATADWCDSMAGWMNGRMNGQGSNGPMTGSMMWRDPDSMRTTCQAWMGSNPDNVPDDIDAAAWCDQMVDWMVQHQGDWDGWMMGRT